MRILLMFLLLLLVNCGVDVHHDGNVGVEMSLDQKIEKYFRAVCVEELPGADEETLTACTNYSVGQFLLKISK